jgi:hypothetical protein
MTEAAKVLTAEEAIQQIRSHIAAYLDGGPDRKEEDVELARNAGLKVEAVSARWDDALKTVLVDLPPLEVVVPPKKTEEAKAETLTVLPAEAQWKRRPVPPDPDEEALEKKKAEASLFLSPVQPEVEKPEATLEPVELDDPAAEPETLPANVDERSLRRPLSLPIRAKKVISKNTNRNMRKNGRVFSTPKLHSTMQGNSWRFVTGAVMRMYEVFNSGRDSFGDGMGHSGE